MAIPHEKFLRMSNCKLLCYLSCRSRGMNFNFPQKKGTGIERLLPHCTQEAIELIYQMCTYDPDERITAKQAIRHPYFKDLRSVLKTVTSRFSFMQMFSFFSLFLKAFLENRKIFNWVIFTKIKEEKVHKFALLFSHVLKTK